MMIGMTFLEACEKLFEEADMPNRVRERGIKSDRDYYYPEPKYAENKDVVYEYWEKRKISRETIDYLGIQQDQRGNTLFQYYDTDDVLRCVKVRPSKPIPHGQTKCWWLKDESGRPYDTAHLLYNQNRINVSQPLIVCCGEGDCASAIECGYKNAVSIPMGDGNLQFVGEQWDWLTPIQSIILVHDNDEAGRKIVSELTRRLGEYRIKVVDLPQTYTTDDGNQVKIKDLNELLFFGGADAVRKAIDAARESEIPCLIDSTDVQDFDMSNVGGVKFGINSIDRLLGKLYFSSVTIFSGSPSSGKTSLLSTLINQSVEQGENVFCFSGELSNPSLKSWRDYVWAGQCWLEEKDDDGFKYYTIKKEAIKQMNAFYKGRVVFYKDSFDMKASSLLAAMEAAVRRYGVKVCVIDNLSVVDLEADDENKWTKQDNFIRDLIIFAQRFDVALCVVIHPRKLQQGMTSDKMSLYDLQGVCSASSLTHRILTLYRVKDEDRQGRMNKNGKWEKKPLRGDVTMTVLKDRFGSALGKTVSLYYDVPSRRFYDTKENLAYQYSWDHTEHQNPLPFFDDKRYDNDEEVFGSVV